MRKIAIFALCYVFLMAFTCRPELVIAQTVDRPDPRGLNRYTLNGTKQPLSIFTYPRYDPRIGEKRFFDGWGRKTAKELGLEKAEFCNEFGGHAECGTLDGTAVIRFKNGMEWDEAYLEGCLRNGKVFFNRIKIFRKPPLAPEVPKVELCFNIPIALKDVPRDWAITKNDDGTTRCDFPVPAPLPTPTPVQLPAPPPIDNTCKPGGNNRIFEQHDKKGFNPIEAINTKLAATGNYDVQRILSLMAVPEGTSKLTDLIIYHNGCDYVVFGYSVVKGGLGWWKWVIPALIIAAFFLGRLTMRKVTPVKTQIIRPDRGGGLRPNNGGFIL